MGGGEDEFTRFDDRLRFRSRLIIGVVRLLRRGRRGTEGEMREDRTGGGDACRVRDEATAIHARNVATSVSESMFWVGRDRWARRFRNVFRRAQDRKSTRLNSSHLVISYAVFC